MVATRFFRTAERPFGDYGIRSVHIEARAEGAIWHQRHVWTRDDGSLEVEEWIPSCPGFWRDDREVLQSDLAA